MTTALVCLIGVLAVLWAAQWRSAWLRHVRHVDAARIAPVRFITGMESFDQKLRDRTTRRRQIDQAALDALKQELRSGKPRLFKAS